MDELVKTVDTLPLMGNYLELLHTVDVLPLRVSGGSMAPFLVDGRDTVYLSRVRCGPKVGDIVLYRRTNGAYILHRICRQEGECFCMAGDAQNEREHGIRREQILAVVRQVERKGRILEPGCFCWEFFEKIWVHVIPCRPTLLRVYGAVSKCFWRKRT